MNSIEVVLAMLLAVVASGYLVRVLPFSLPLPLVQICMGAVIDGVFKHGVALDPEIFFLLFLPPLLFLDGWCIPKDGLLRDRGVILELALGLVVFTVIGVGLLIHWLIPAMPPPRRRSPRSKRPIMSCCRKPSLPMPTSTPMLPPA